MVLHRT